MGYRAKLVTRMKAARRMRGLTQQQAADALDMERSSYARYETGAREPDLDMLERLTQLFAVSASYLIGETDAPEAAPNSPSTEGEVLDVLGDLSEGEKREVLRFTQFIRERK